MLVVIINSVGIEGVVKMAKEKRVKYKPYNLVFYTDEQYLYEALKKVSKANRRNMRDTIMCAIETLLQEENSIVNQTQSSMNSTDMEEVEYDDEMEQW